MQKSIVDLTEEVNTLSPISLDVYQEQSISHVQAQGSGRTAENTIEMASSISLKTSSKPALKLPQLFHLTPNWSRKSTDEAKHQHFVTSRPEKSNRFLKENPLFSLFASDHANATTEDSDIYVQNLRRAVREAVLSVPLSNSENSGDKTTNAGSEHFFVPCFIDVPQKEVGEVGSQRKQHLFSSRSSEDSLEEVLSPSYESVFDDCDEDLLAPLSETDAALMETSGWLQHSFLPTCS